MGTETQTQIDNITKTDQATPGTTDQITVSRLNITSMLDQRTLILNAKKKFPQSNKQPTANSVQFINHQGQDVINTLSGFFPLNF